MYQIQLCCWYIYKATSGTKFRNPALGDKA